MYRWQQRCGLSLSVLQQLIIIISIIFKPMSTKPQVVKISQKRFTLWHLFRLFVWSVMQQIGVIISIIVIIIIFTPGSILISGVKTRSKSKCH